MVSKGESLDKGVAVAIAMTEASYGKECRDWFKACSVGAPGRDRSTDPTFGPEEPVDALGGPAPPGGYGSNAGRMREAMIPHLLDDEFDVILAGMSITDGRRID